MQASQFTKKSSGKLVQSLQGHLTFLPKPLPPQIIWNAELAFAQSAADSALGRLNGMGQHWASRHLLTRTFTIREAVQSSKIEGTEAEISDLFLFEADHTRKPRVN